MNLESYFRINFALIQYHKWSLTEIENMMPFERDIYVILLKNHLDEEEEKSKNRSQQGSTSWLTPEEQARFNSPY
jgi:hypothetical protein